jgi:xanthine dehydrogenase YagR molybdenum-binding subunit
VYGAIAFSTIAKGVISHIDTTAAEQAPGVIKVFTHLNAPPMKVAEPFAIGGEPSAGGSAVNILNTDRISWNGQPVAVVVADTEDRAEDAASLVVVTYAVRMRIRRSMSSANRPKSSKEMRMRSCDRHRIGST